MKSTELHALLVSAIADGHAAVPVIIRAGERLTFTFDATTDTPMVRACAGAGPYVLGRKNARRYVCVEANVANFPNVASARRDCLTVAQLRKILAVADPTHTALARSGMILDAAAFREISRAEVASINRAGSAKIVSRGGVPAFVLSFE